MLLVVMAGTIMAPLPLSSAESDDVIIAFRDTRFRMQRFRNGKPAFAIDSLIITSPVHLNKFGKPDPDGVYRPDWLQLYNGVVLSSVPPDYAVPRADSLRARFESLKSETTVTVDEDGYWLASPGFTRYGMRPEDQTPLGQPLEYNCGIPSETTWYAPGEARPCQVNYYWSPSVSVAYNFNATRLPKAQWRALDQLNRGQLRALQIQ